MKRIVVAASCAALALGVAWLAPSASADPPPGAPDAPVVQPLTALEDGLAWGMSHDDVIKVYNRIGGLFDKEYDPKLMKVQPGVDQEALEAERDNRKAGFGASWVQFNDTPTGYDATGVKDEYTYRNHESAMVLDKDGKRRYFFFIGSPPSERLWKIYDEIPLKAGGPMGATYSEAVVKLTQLVGASPRIIRPDPRYNQRFTTCDWQDTVTHLRADDRSGDRVVGVVLEDKQTLSVLPQLRANKAVDPLALDPSIAAITRGTISDPNAARATPDAGTKRRR